MFDTIQPLILASASPRRQGYLAVLGISYEVVIADVVEKLQQGEGPDDFVLRLAHAKAEYVGRSFPDSWVLGADTVVALNEQILGKPADAAAARTMLMTLVGKWHDVWTGFCILNAAQEITTSRAIKTKVRFAELDDAVIDAYIESGEPLDKAGGYGIQGRAGFFVKEIRGSYSNIVGLPLAEVVAQLMALKIIVPGGRRAT